MIAVRKDGMSYSESRNQARERAAHAHLVDMLNKEIRISIEHLDSVDPESEQAPYLFGNIFRRVPRAFLGIRWTKKVRLNETEEVGTYAWQISKYTRLTRSGQIAICSVEDYEPFLFGGGPHYIAQLEDLDNARLSGMIESVRSLRTPRTYE